MKTIEPYKIILADDHILLRDALADLISDFVGFTIMAKAANGKEVIEFLEKGFGADILIIDLNMPVMDGFETAKLVAKKYPLVKIVILTMHDNEIGLARLLQIGICGFLKKDVHPAELNKALLTIAAGGEYYSHQTAIKIATMLNKRMDTSSLERIFLNEMEVEFLKLASTDMTYPEIARTMRRPPTQIENLRKKLFEKLKVESRIGLAIYAFKNGIITF